MWTRKELKQQARDALQRNYWRIVLVSLILLALGNSNVLGRTSYSAAGTAGTAVEDVSEESGTGDEALMDFMESDYSAMDVAMASIESLVRETDNSMERMGRAEVIITGIIVFVICLIIILILIAFLLAFDMLLFNPFIVGAQRFMLKSVDGKAEVKEAAYAFDHSYKNVVKVMFRTKITIFLWSLLFIIPGLYKKYQYRMVEYIMAEHPDLHYKAAMQMSKDMMEGEKWHAFVLDLSFILWGVVGVMTCGTALILFVAPYQYLTNAALYRKLCAVRRQQDFGGTDSILVNSQ